MRAKLAQQRDELQQNSDVSLPRKNRLQQKRHKLRGLPAEGEAADCVTVFEYD